MKYTCKIEINLPIEEVISKFDNADNLKHWQPGLESVNHISGTPGTVGAKTKLVYKMGKRRVEIIETIIKRDLPDAFDGTYESNGAFNRVKIKFKKLTGNSTGWEHESEFQFKGMMKFIGFLLPGAFKKQSMKYLYNFKKFAESGVSVLDKK